MNSNEFNSSVASTSSFNDVWMSLSELEKKVFLLADELIEKHHVLDVHSLALQASRIMRDIATPPVISQAIHSLISKKIFFEGGSLTRKTVLANETRKQMYDLILNHPGIRFSAIMDILGKDTKTVVVYLKVLERFDLIRRETIAGKKAYFDFNLPKDLDAFHYCMQDETMRIILKAILDYPDSSLFELEELLKDSISTPVLARKVRILLDHKLITGKTRANELISLKVLPGYAGILKAQDLP